MANHLTDTDKHYWKVHKVNTTQIANNETQTKQIYPGLVASYDTWPENDKSLFYNAPEPTCRNSSINVYHTYTDTFLTCVSLHKHSTQLPSSLL